MPQEVILIEKMAIGEKHLIYMELTMYAYPRIAEARLGAQWAQDTHNTDLNAAWRVTRRAGLVGRVFSNCNPHALRILGRTSFACGKKAKARRYFDQSIRIFF